MNHCLPYYLSFFMKTIRLISVAFFLSLLSSCSLIQSILKVPGGVLKSVGRTAGMSFLTDEAPDPVAPETVKKAVPAEE